jgi:hypothetical protein
MESIKIDTGTVRLAVNDDPNRVISFNPNDAAFAERFYALLRELEEAQAKYQQRAQEIDQDEAVDGYGIPVNAGERLAFQREVCEDFRAKIDAVFGKGTSQAAFGDDLVLDAFRQFFEGVMAYITTAREKKVARYTGKQKSARVLK